MAIRYASFLSEATADTGWSTVEVARVAPAVIATLEERLTRRERHALETHLPSRLRERLRREEISDRSAKKTADDFVRRVAARVGEVRDDLDVLVRLVFRALRAHLSAGEAHQIEVQLSDDVRRLWNPPSFGRR
jgi:uncharacterized protein (DUF2267 family)